MRSRVHWWRRLAPVPRTWIGLDPEADHGEPVVALLRVGWGRLRLRSCVWRELPAALRRQAAAGARCACALPPSEGLAVPLDAPRLPAFRRRRVLPALLDLNLPFPLEQCASAFAEPPGARPVGLAVRHEDLRRALDAWRQRGFDPERCVPLEWVLWNQSLREFPILRERPSAAAPEYGRVVVLATGAAGERLVVVTGKGAAFGSAAAVRRDDPAAFRRILAMAFGGSTQGLHCLCAGEGAQALATELAGALEGGGDVRCAASPEAFVARGLAWDAFADPEGAVQVRQPPFEHPATETRRRRRLQRIRGLVLAGAVLLFGTSLCLRSALVRREERQRALLEERIETVAGYRVATRGPRAVEEACAALEERLDPVVERFRAPGAPQALRQILAAAAALDVRLTHLELAGRSVTLSGRASAPAPADAFEDRLRTAGLRVRLQREAVPVDANEVRFFMTPEALP